MIKTIIFIAGLFIFIFSLYSINFLNIQEKKALSRDNKKTSFGEVMGPPECNWEVKTPDRVISEEKSQALIINTANNTNDTCISAINLSAPGFDITPSKTDRDIKLPPKQKGSVSWVLTPRKSGDYTITVSDILNTKIIGITVTNIFGLTSFQAQIFSIFGSLFGPMLTIPWWLEKFINKKKQEANKS